MPKVCKEIFKRTVVYTQHKIKEEKVDIWGESYTSEYKGELKVTYEDKLIEIKLLQCYSDLELTLNTNIYKDGIIVGKVYKIELDSEGDILYFLEPEYKLTQPDDTFKEYLRKVKDVEAYIELEEEIVKLKKESIYLKSSKESYENTAYERLNEIRDLNDKNNDYYNEIKLKDKEIDELKEKVECIRNNVINDIKEIMKNTTILERLNMSKFINTLEELKK